MSLKERELVETIRVYKMVSTKLEKKFPNSEETLVDSNIAYIKARFGIYIRYECLYSSWLKRGINLNVSHVYQAIHEYIKNNKGSALCQPLKELQRAIWHSSEDGCGQDGFFKKILLESMK